MKSRRPLVAVFVIALVMLVALPAVATFTPGFYKNKGADLWDDVDDGIVAGDYGCDGTGFVSSDEIHGLDVTYGEILKLGNAKDMTLALTKHLVAAELNLAFGACDAVWGDEMRDLADWSHAFLVVNPLGSDPRGADRSYAGDLKTCLDYHNNIPDGWTEADYLVSSAAACYAALD